MMNDVKYMSDAKPLASIQPINDVVRLQTTTPSTFNPPKKYVSLLSVKQYHPETSNSLLDVILSPEGNRNLLKEEPYL